MKQETLPGLMSASLALAVNLAPCAVSAQEAATPAAVRTADFLNSIGIDATFPDRGQPLAKTIEMVKYVGFRWVRGGIEGLSANGPTTVQTYLDLHRQTGVRFSWGLASGGTDLKKLIESARPLAEADALLAFEGNNEPNNWGVTYQGEKGGGEAPSWMAVAKLQRDLYAAVKGDPLLKKYPVWSVTENGAERDNVGLQFLTIPSGAGTLMPTGTKYADYANVHNYIYHPASSLPMDNKTWNAADPGPACRVDGLYGNYGRLFRGRTCRAAQGHHGDRLPDRQERDGRAAGAQPHEPVPGSVQAGMELYLRLPSARPHGRGRQSGLRVL